MKQIQMKVTSLVLVFGMLSSCAGISSSPLVAALQGVGYAAAAASAAAPILAGNGVISNDDATLIETVAQETSTAVPAAITEAESTDTNPVKLSKIITDFDPVITTVIPATVSSQAAGLILGIKSAIQALLAQLGAPALAKLAVAHPAFQIVLSRSDKSALSKIETDAKATNANAQAWISLHPKK
jgi:hypothetical protein